MNASAITLHFSLSSFHPSFPFPLISISFHTSSETVSIFFPKLEDQQNGEEAGNSSSAGSENILEKGEVEATKEGEKEKDKDEKEAAEKDKDGNEQEVVFIQDMGFTVKIVSPGAEPFDIQVSSMELVQVNNFPSFPTFTLSQTIMNFL